MEFVVVARALKKQDHFQRILEERKSRLDNIFEETIDKNSTNYDCLIPVSGGKDSYYQAHVILQKLMVSNHY